MEEQVLRVVRVDGHVGVVLSAVEGACCVKDGLTREARRLVCVSSVGVV